MLTLTISEAGSQLLLPCAATTGQFPTEIHIACERFEFDQIPEEKEALDKVLSSLAEFTQCYSTADTLCAINSVGPPTLRA